MLYDTNSMMTDELAISALLDAIAWTQAGLVPCVAQQHDTGEVLMVAWMDRSAVRETLVTGRVCYFSRSRNRLWRKGETSVDQVGVACHTGRLSCFYRAARDGALVVLSDPTLDPAVLYGPGSAAS
jgi:phosphoribosyl-AMP cyclohydrolase